MKTALTLSIASLISFSHAADWSNWRGPTLNGTNPEAKPPSAGPITNPTPKAAPIMPKAAPRSSGLAISAI